MTSTNILSPVSPLAELTKNGITKEMMVKENVQKARYQISDASLVNQYIN